MSLRLVASELALLAGAVLVTLAASPFLILHAMRTVDFRQLRG